MKNAKYFLLILLFISIKFNTKIIAQSSNENIQSGFSNYQSGDYKAAINSFNKVIQSYTTESTEPVTSESRETYISENNKSETDVSDRELTKTSKISYTDVSKKQLVETETMKYVSAPLEYQGDEPAKVYLYRGRTYLKMGDKEAALMDFDKAVSLDPTLSDAYFRRAVANTNIDPDKACPDLLAAIERGHESARELYNLICK